MMDSPEPSKIKRCSSALNAAANTPSSDSPQVQESPFLRFASNLSPMRPPKACHAVGQAFLGLSSPPLVFKSPRVNCHRESQYLERAQGTQSTSGEISQSYNGGSGIRESLREAPGDSNETNSQLPLPERFTTGTQQDFDLENDTSCSPPTSIDEYLADPGDTDEMYSVKPDAEQSSDAVESAPSNLTRTKKYILKCKGNDDPGDKAEEPLPLSEESNEVHQERPAHVENLDTEGGNKVVEWVSQEHTKLESNLAADVSHNSLSQHAGKERDHSDCIRQSMPDPLQGVKESKDCHKMVSTLHVKGGNISQDGSEASLKHHGIRRRLLLFEEAATSALGSNTSYMKLTASSRNMNIVNLSEPVTSLYPQRGVPVTGSKPAGIGLHLNSIINAMPPGPASTTGMRSSDGLRGMQSTCSISLHKVETMKRYLISSNMDRQSLVDNRDEIHETDASLAADCLISESPSLTEPIASYHASEHDKRKLSPTDAGNSEEFNQLSTGKKKKKTSSSADDNGCKRCNCKKSKCLKLYCDCFAAGIFCRDSCSCQDCFNKPEHDDKVTEARQQIESRNPLAFAPKIVQSTTNVLSNMEDVNLTTPSSARHKRGCNCKRSMCLKKYCECYQSNVGCSSGCRCEGCKNVYGRKEDFVASEHALSKEKVTSNVEKGSDSTILVKPEMVASREDLSRNELYDQHHLSPITPSLQCSDQGKEAANSRLVYGKYLPSPDSVVNMFSSRSTLILTDSCDSQIYCNNENVRDQSSPPRNSAAFIAQVTPRSNPDSTSGAPSFPAKPVWTNGPPSRVSQGCIRQISGGSLRWRSSPNTPMRTSSGEAQHLQGLESDSRLFDIVEDETPAILKESSTPTKPVKVNSPIQKRVSPPRVIGSSSSGGLKNGRKFILKSVPSFPPLTPCVDSKGNSNKDSGNDDDATK